jgi:hypothetical protein
MELKKNTTAHSLGFVNRVIVFFGEYFRAAK